MIAASPTPYPDNVLRTLNALTSDFYDREAHSFSATRQNPWQGWGQALDAIFKCCPSFRSHTLSLLDIACGNLRFERYLEKRDLTIGSICAVDNCTDLVQSVNCGTDGPRAPIDFHKSDVAKALVTGKFPGTLLPSDHFDLAVCFGFMHHLASFSHRATLLSSLLSSLKPQGFAIVSFWQFMNDPRIANKAEQTTLAGRATHQLPALHANDFLLGWQHAKNVYRFCHHTSDEEIDALLGDVALPFYDVARFHADGKSGNLNCYVVLQRR